MSFWDIDYDTLPSRLLPVRLRQPRMVAFMKALLAPVKRLYTAFTALRLDAEYKLAHSGQVCYIEDALNDVFDAADKRIYILDGERDEAWWLALDIELRPQYLALDAELDPVWLPTDAELTDGTDFIVFVPSAVAAAPGYDLARLKAIVNFYKLPGKQYSVIVF